MKHPPLWQRIRAKKLANLFRKKRLRNIRHATKKLMHDLRDGTLDFFDYMRDNT